jgi:hypothetical protein
MAGESWGCDIGYRDSLLVLWAWARDGHAWHASAAWCYARDGAGAYGANARCAGVMRCVISTCFWWVVNVGMSCGTGAVCWCYGHGPMGMPGMPGLLGAMQGMGLGPMGQMQGEGT